MALGPTPKPDDVDAVVGSVTWTHRMCEECKEQVAEAVMIHGLPNLHLFTCRACAEMMVGLFADGDGE